MKAILKEGNPCTIYSIRVYKDVLIINLLKERWQYVSSIFKKGRLHIYFQDIEDVELAFTGDMEDIEFQSQEKDQIIFTVLY